MRVLVLMDKETARQKCGYEGHTARLGQVFTASLDA